MSTGGNGLPDYDGGSRDLYSSGSYDSGSYDSGSYDSGGYSSGGYSSGGYGSSGPEDPYAVGPDGTDPYRTGPSAADDFAPSFGTSAEPSSQHAADRYAPVAPGPVPHGQAPYGSASYGQSPYGQTPYGPVPYGPYAPVAPSSGSAIAGFVLGVLGLVFCAGLTSPFGIVFSSMGMKETGPAATPPKSGRGLAIAGLVVSLIGLIPLAISLFYIVLFVVAIATAPSS